MNANHAQDNSDKQPSSEPEQLSSAAITDEPWQDLRAPNREVAAYQAGRLLNLLEWRLVFSLFSGSSKHKAAVGDVVGRLKGVSHYLSTGAEATIADEIEEAMAGFGPKTEPEADNLLSGLDGLRDEGDPYAPSFIPVEDLYRDLFAGWIEPVINAIRQAFRKRLTSEESWLLRLGETIDQGLRRSDVCVFMPRQYQECQADAEEDAQDHDGSDSKKQNTGVSPKDADGEEKSSVYAIMRMERGYFNIGEELPGDSWYHELPYLCEKAGIPGAISADSINLLTDPTARQIRAFIEKGDEKIRKNLSANLTDSTPPRECPSVRPTDRIPPEERTKPMSYRRAAKLMGKGDSRDAAEWLSASVKDDSIRCEHISRQTHVFSRCDFPKEAWRLILVAESIPTDPNFP